MNDAEEEDYFYRNSITKPGPYIPKTLGEIYDQLGAMVLHVPRKFKKKTGYFPETFLEADFYELNNGLKLVREKLGEDNHAKAIDMSARAKALFEADPDMKTGQAEDGIVLLDEISDLIRDARRRRVRAKLKDDLGEVSGD